MSDEKKGKNGNKIENKSSSEDIFRKVFFKKMWYSITKIESYPELATEGVPRAINYFAKLVALLAIVISLASVYKFNGILKQGTNYLENNFPDFSYKEGVLTVDSESPIILEESIEQVGKIIIDVQTDSEEQINEYIEEVSKKGNGLVVLKNKVIMKNEAIAGTAYYNYKEMLSQIGFTEFTKQDIIKYLNSNQIFSFYISLFITLFMYAFAMYFVNYLLIVLTISIVGCITNLVTKLRMRYAAIFNMTVYSVTLSTILNMIYIAVNAFIDFSMPYFDVMYVSVAAIYLIAAIFIIRADAIKKHEEVMKIVDVQKEVRKELEEKESQEKEKKERKEADKEKERKDKKEEKKDGEEKNQEGTEPQGSNA